MGLDMYLTKDTYIGAYFEHRKVEAKIEITIEGKKVEINPANLETITERVAYWRKAHDLHQMFVKIIQEGVDECQKSYISKAKMIEMRDACIDYIDNENGNEYEIEDAKLFIEVIEPLIEDEDCPSIHYQSSW